MTKTKISGVGDVFARRLREVRQAKEWRQQDLAEALAAIGLPMDRTTIAKIEKRQREARLDEVMAIAAVLDVSPMSLFLPPEAESGHVNLAPALPVDVVGARQWARGELPLGSTLEAWLFYREHGSSERGVRRDRLSEQDQKKLRDEGKKNWKETEAFLRDAGVEITYTDMNNKEEER